MDKNAMLTKIQAWAKRRGFVYPSSEIYGGLANTWDYGPYGTQLKNNIRDSWWKKFVEKREDIIGIDSSIIVNPKTWEASGHVTGFTDVLVDCKNCKNRTRADHLIESNLGINVEGRSIDEINKLLQDNKFKCPECGVSNWTDARDFNILFETQIGILTGKKSKAYLRGETAQGIFLTFKNIVDSMRVRIPFGIAQIGKAFRNEITKGQFIYRTLEFEQMEIEYFINPSADWNKIYNQWMEEMKNWYESIGINLNNLRTREHSDEERAFYSKKTEDIEYKFDFGWKEISGLAYRTDYDLSQHQEMSGKDLTYKDPATGEKYLPHVIEPSLGLDRAMMAVMYDAYTEEDLGDGKSRVALKFPPHIAPVKAAVFPLQKDEKLQEKAREIFASLRDNIDGVIEFDDAGNIGKMYRRQDEIGTPACITIDYQTLEDNSVTIRDRDTMKQKRVAVDEIDQYLSKKYRV